MGEDELKKCWFEAVANIGFVMRRIKNVVGIHNPILCLIFSEVIHRHCKTDFG